MKLITLNKPVAVKLNSHALAPKMVLIVEGEIFHAHSPVITVQITKVHNEDGSILDLKDPVDISMRSSMIASTQVVK